jgi:hypothetical protein
VKLLHFYLPFPRRGLVQPLPRLEIGQPEHPYKGQRAPDPAPLLFRLAHSAPTKFASLALTLLPDALIVLVARIAALALVRSAFRFCREPDRRHSEQRQRDGARTPGRDMTTPSRPDARADYFTANSTPSFRDREGPSSYEGYRT